MQKKKRKQYKADFKAKVVKEMLNEQRLHQSLDYRTPAEVYFAG